ncbi:MAG: molecular chaperone HtpG [Clostridia bacterium]|nr:molecular chaperone HtpG [Clostridia bacterium]
MAKKQFKAESKRLLDLMINSIYTNKEIFLRELISNANDAIDKLSYLSLTDEAARAAMTDPAIRVEFNKEEGTVTVTDNGIGMTKEELEENLGTIARSGSLAFKENMTAEEENEAANIIGQFGVGFYSAFMVADKVTVLTRSYKSEQGYKWVSDGVDGYTVTETDKTDVGTVIEMHLKEDTEEVKYSEFCDEYRLKNLIKTYSDYIRHPIVMKVTKYKEEGEGEDKKQVPYTEDDTVNSRIPLWQKSKNDVTEEELNGFYKDTFYDFEDPLLAVQTNAEGLVAYKSLLFVPAKTPYNYYTKDFEKGLKLYSSGVLITDKCEELLPDHFRFVKGVVDSEDLSLNISREMLQQTHQLKTIANGIEKKIKSELKKLMGSDREKYEKFFAAFGLQLKYGVVSDFGVNKDKLKDLLVFRSLKEDKYISIAEYIAAMPEEQKHIYYACGESLSMIGGLPQVELIRDKGYDMLMLTDEVDEFVMQTLRAEGEKDYCSINSEGADLLDKSDEEKAETAEKENKELLEFVKEALSGKVFEVTVSKKLKTHPVCLSTSGPVTLEMEKYFAQMPGDEAQKPKAQRVLELNAAHPVFEKLKTAFDTDKDRAKAISELLYGQALLIAGLYVDDPAAWTETVLGLI